MRYFSALVLILLVSSCSLLEKKEEIVIPIVSGIPSLETLTDSLNARNAKSVKWVVNQEEILYALDEQVDWEKEFEIFAKSNVNNVRFRDSYNVTDTIIGKTRSVLFLAIDESQEVRKMTMRMENNRIVYFEVVKSKSNVFSNSNQHFVFDHSEYTLSIDQKIKGVFSNQQFVHGTILAEGTIWRGEFDLGDQTLPIQLIIDVKNHSFYSKNGLELVGFNDFNIEGDTLVFKSDAFDSEFRLKLVSDSLLEGRWINQKNEAANSLAFTANRNVPYRFKVSEIPNHDLTGYHKSFFYNQKGEVEDSSLLKLDQYKHTVTGSILTETGDYRFLEGVVRNDSLLMSTMDGTHAYYLTAAIKDGELIGEFRSGYAYRVPWNVRMNVSFELRDPEEITRLNPDSTVHFSFPDENGKFVSLSDEDFADKPVIISLMGTWCSNCLDESRFLKEVETLYGPKGLKIVALDFELIGDSARAINNIKRHRKNIGVDYPVLLASLFATKQKAHQAAPYLSSVTSYPTLIVLDKNHKVVRIHTGFSGPATGPMHYEAFRMEYLSLFNKLVQE